MRSLLCAVVAACTVANSLAQEGWGFTLYRTMDEWPSLCHEGTQQSPINIDTGAAIASPMSRGSHDFVTMGTLRRYNVWFTGTAMRADFTNFSVPADVRIPANEYKIGNSTTVKEGGLLRVDPLYMTIHTPSEHAFDGYFAPAELQIVVKVREGESDHCDTSGGCLAVFALMMTYDGHGNEGSPALVNLFSTLPNRTGVEHGVTVKSQLNLDDFFASKGEYFIYLGSMTSPPCKEIVTWHVYTQPIPISVAMIKQYQDLVAFTPGDDCLYAFGGTCAPPRERTNGRPIQLRNGRTVYYVNSQN